MPRWPEETQKKADQKHAKAALELESSKALMEVPSEARRAMPLRMFFWERNNFVEQGPANAILGGNYLPSLDSSHLKKLGKKCQFYFGVYPNQWCISSLQSSKDQSEELQSFNSTLTRNPMKWTWDKDRQISGFIWLTGSEEKLIEFPYLKDPMIEEDIPSLTPYLRRMVLFPSHPMYAFKFLPQEKEIFFLEIHGTFKNKEKSS